MPTVMVVDDTAVIRETVAKLLKREGFDTICASNGKEALAVLNASAPDVILLDIMMPEMDGLECLALLRKEPRWQALPVIIMTAMNDEEHQMKAERLGASDYLIKARYSMNQILERVRKLIAQKAN
jgi:CheY-like chemotaxis protein